MRRAIRWTMPGTSELASRAEPPDRDYHYRHYCWEGFRRRCFSRISSGYARSVVGEL